MNAKKRLVIILTVYLLLVVFSCKQGDNNADNRGYEYQAPQQTGDGWQTASLADVGMDPAPLVDLMVRLSNSGNHYIHGLIIIKDAKLVFEEYFNGYECDLARDDLLLDGELNLVYTEFNHNTKHLMASASKSVTSILFGIAKDKGFIQDLDEKMSSYFSDYSQLIDQKKEQITLKHLLTMRTGLPWEDGEVPIYHPDNDEYKLFYHQDPIRFLLEMNVIYTPGTVFEYNSGATMLLGEIVKRTTGTGLVTFGKNFLFSPLGITSYKWVRHKNAPAITHASGGLYLRPRDMAKIGQLILQDGTWQGNRIVSSAWVKDSLRDWVSVNTYNFTGYGYQWWLGAYTSGAIAAYTAAGWGGQFIVVLPAKNMVVVHTAGGYKDDTMWNVPIMYSDIIEYYILPAVL